MRLPTAIWALAALLITPAQAVAQDWNTWLNARLDSVVAVRLQLRDPTKVPSLPAASATEASLVDRSAMPDIGGISIALPGQPASDGQTPGSGLSFATSAYMLWGLLKGQGLLDPGFYNRSALAKRIGLNLAFDTDDSTGVTATLLQAKLKVLDRGPLLADEGAARRVRAALEAAADEYGRLNMAINTLLFKVLEVRSEERTAFLNSLNVKPSRDEVLAKAGPDALRAIDRAIEQHVASFIALSKILSEIVAQSRSRPEAALGVTYRDEPGAGSETRIVGILDLLAQPSVDLTVNSGVEIVDPDGADNRVRFEIASQLLFLLSQDNRFDGRAPISLAVAGSGQFAKDEIGIWRVQARLLLPIAEGVNVPASVTWASRSDLIEESRLIGQVGFSFDASQIFAALR
jgi:hypothetical protein